MVNKLSLAVALAFTTSTQQAVAQPTSAAHPAVLSGFLGNTAFPQGRYQQDDATGEVRLTSTDSYIVELDTPPLYPQLSQVVGTLSPDYSATIGLSSAQWQQLSASDVQVAATRVLNAQQQARIQLQSRYPNVQIVDQFSKLHNSFVVKIHAQQPMQLAAQLALLPNVKSVHPVQLVHTMLADSVPLIQAPAVWQLQRGGEALKGKGIRVAVLDTGVDYRHSALGGCFGVGCKVAGGYDFVANDTDPLDVNGHGTHVASIIAGQSNSLVGVAPEASIYAYKVLGDNGYGSTLSILAGIEKAIDPDGDPTTADGAHIINMSLGNSQRDPTDPMVVAVNNAVNAGVLVVVAAGNQGPGAESIGSPGIADTALTVAATEKNDELSSYSSRGPGVGAALFKPEIAAPGSNILAAVPNEGYQQKSGTSMAAPHVAGAAALVLQADPSLTASMLKQRLLQTTDRLSGTYWDRGTGRLNVLSAVQNVLSVDVNQLYLGRVNSATFESSGQRTMALTNHGSQTLTVALSTSSVPNFLTASIATPSVTLAAGETKTVQFAYQVDSSKLPTTLPLDLGYTLYVQLNAGSQTLSIPVILDHFYSLKVNAAQAVSEITVYDDQWRWQREIGFIPANGSMTLRTGLPKLQLRTAFLQPPAALAVGENTVPLAQKTWSFQSVNDVKATAEITVSTDDVKHRLRFKPLKKQGVGAYALDLKHAWATHHIEFTGGNASTYGFGYNCFNDSCGGVTPLELYLSDLPAGVSQFQQQLFFSKASQQLFVVAHRFPQPLATADIEVDFQATDRVTLQKTMVGNYVVQMGPDLIETMTGNLNMQLWYKAVNLSANDLVDAQISIKPVDAETGDSISTHRWQLTEQGVLEKYRCKWSYCNRFVKADYEQIYSADSRDMSFDNNIRYMTAAVEHVGGRLSLLPRGVTQDLTKASGLVRDLWFNDAVSFKNIRASLLCGTTESLLPTLVPSILQQQGDGYDTNVQLPADCVNPSFKFSYPMADHASVGLWGELVLLQKQAGQVSPWLTNVYLQNRTRRSDVISRIDNTMAFDVQTGSDAVKSVLVQLKNKTAAWQTVYEAGRAGHHQFALPQQAGEQWLDLRIEISTVSGNLWQNTMPEAVLLGAAAGGDNDVDSDGIPNASDSDNDNDGVADVSDAFVYNPNESLDTDQDGLGNNTDPDDDNDGVADEQDAFPLDKTESLDTDRDGIGNNADPDDDNDGVVDARDAFPLDKTESVDTDHDGVGNNADADDDNDGVVDSRDAFPLDKTESFDTDQDGIGNNADTDDDNDGVADAQDAFPLDKTESVDTDQDGIGNNADTDDDNDGVVDAQDAFPLDKSESVDTDKDGIGNNADTDDDNDGVSDTNDKYPLDSSKSVDPNSANNGGTSGGAGLDGLWLLLVALSRRRRRQA